ncbi:hypothetical protein [Oryza sativa Japonica Group]|uniref:Uncharacterized protein n=1 Tax=Oryza sativa subsp. japonica TaxID=39947 RepID=Q5QMR8_ORYSJ|nr:hypothetical protein [Oryza sativa Japonica Group]
MEISIYKEKKFNPTPTRPPLPTPSRRTAVDALPLHPKSPNITSRSALEFGSRRLAALPIPSPLVAALPRPHSRIFGCRSPQIPIPPLRSASVQSPPLLSRSPLQTLYSPLPSSPGLPSRHRHSGCTQARRWHRVQWRAEGQRRCTDDWIELLLNAGARLGSGAPEGPGVRADLAPHVHSGPRLGGEFGGRGGDVPAQPALDLPHCYP